MSQTPCLTPPGRAVTPSRPRLSLAALVIFCWLGVPLLAGSGSASANDNCKESSGVTTCEGDQSAGVQNGHNNIGTNADDVVVKNLNQDIGPNLNSSRTSGLMFTYDSGDDLTTLTLQYLESNHRIVVNGAAQSGILFAGPVKNGDDGKHHDTSSGGNGDAGKPGRNLDLTLASGATIVGGSNAITTGIQVDVPGGNGGEGGGSDCCSGGHGGAGGQGGNVSIVGAGSIDMQGPESPGVAVTSGGGLGGNGHDSSNPGEHGGNGEVGGAAGLVQLDSADSWTITTSGVGFDGARGVTVTNLGAAGGDGGKGDSHGGDGGGGGSGHAIKVNKRDTGAWSIDTVSNTAAGISLGALGGGGGHGGHGDDDHGGKGGQGGQGGAIELGQGDYSITTGGSQSSGLFAYSKAGSGGNGGSSEFSDPGDGGSGGGGGAITIAGDWQLSTAGSQSHGLALYSLGAAGGQGGSGDFTSGGAGGSTGTSGAINVNISGSIATAGGGALGLVAQSVAGHAGSGGESSGVVSFAGNGGSAGAGGTVTVTNDAAITTRGDQSTVIAAQSIGGGGGSGGDGFSDYYSQGGSGGLGGAGGAVTVDNKAALQAGGDDAIGIFAQSIGGAGGSGGNAGGIVSLGGGGKAGANGGTVSISNSATIATGVSSGSAPSGPDPVCGSGCSPGILAQSIGGGGGHGGTAIGAFSVGAAGGKGGNGAKVTVATTGDVATTQRQSTAIHAQSVGGGGGNGGGGGSIDAVLSVAVGGSGGDGGSGGQVKVTPTSGSALSTLGDDASAVHAQSVGGSGGNAGFAVSAAGGVDVPALDVAVGASGGDGGGGSAVSIDTVDSGYTGSTPNRASTSGERSHGLFAQSVGGGGGNAGLTVAFSSSNQTNASVAVGGSGGSGGNGGSATINSDAQVAVSGASANALFAQSIGGGGGNGGTTISGDLNLGGGGLAVAVGGGGGSGGSGSTVTLTSSGQGQASTSGDQGSALLAQSIGGGGGNGGLTVSGTLSSSSGGSTIGVAVGSPAGSGGKGGAVTVNATASGGTTASGNRGVGIMAQSIGGGGGNGGMTLNGNVAASTDSKQFAVTLGSAGGSGGSAGAVKISNTRTVSTGSASQVNFTQAHGVFAQSVGGGGGSGALTGALNLGFNDDTQKYSVNLQMSDSGAGGAGGSATISNSGAVSTQNRNSHALFAQSVGGGGGDADAALLSLIDKTTNNPAPSISTSYVAAGTLGAGNTGGPVSVSNSAALSTSGPWSHGVFAQSVGGGGGSNAPLGNPFTFCSSCPSDAAIWNATVALGGKTGSGGDGGDVTVTSSGAIATSGAGSDAIFAQSIGAGGGSAGAASALSQGSQYIHATEFTAINAALGATGQGSTPASGDGGTVSVTHSAGAITTVGIGSTAIYAQSVGAGGGRGATGAIGGGGNIDVGANGAAAGNGGKVSVTVSGGSIEAGTGTGAAGIVSAAYGIFAQSVGGGGGHSGNVLFGSTDNFASAAGLTSSKGSDSSGNGGAVTVNLGAALTTSGNSSVGILAQSVGGGGGIQGEAGKTQSGARAGSNGGSGKPGVVSVTVSGSVTTSGANAHGIWAQGAGGSGDSTTSTTQVAVNLNGTGSVLAQGAGSIGIYAQSVGDGRGPVAINLNTDVTFVAGETAIYIKDAPTSSILNNGGIASQDLSNGIAVQAENTTLTITNTSTGNIEGQVCKGSSCGTGTTPGSSLGHITLNNQPGGSVTSTRLEVDQFNNNGTLDIGGIGNTTQTIITGNYSSGSSSTLVVELDPSRTDAGAIDSLLVGGIADLDGAIDLRLKDVGLQIGPRRWALITALGGITAGSSDRLLLPGSTAVLTLELEQTLQQLLLSYEVDFANQRIEAAANDDQAAIGEHLQRVFVEGGGDLQDLLETLASISDPGDYANSLDAFKPELYANNQLSALFAGQHFADQLMSCSQREGAHRFISQGQCVWASLSAQRLQQDSSSQDFGFRENSQQLAAGAQFDLGGQWFLGGGLAYEDSDLNLKQGRGDSDGERYQGGLALKRQFGASLLAVGVSGGIGRFDNRRTMGAGQRVDGKQDLRFLSGQLRAAHAFEFNRSGIDWALKPRLDLAIDSVHSDRIKENGAGSLSLIIEDNRDTWVSLQPAVDLQAEWQTAAGTLLRPNLTLGLTHFLSDTDPSSTAVFAGSPGGISGFETTTGLDRTYLDLGAGIEVIAKPGWNLRLTGSARLSSDIHSYGGSLRLAVPF